MVKIRKAAREVGAIAVGTATTVSLTVAAGEGTLQLLRNAPSGIADLAMVGALVITLFSSSEKIFNGARQLFGLERMETDREKLIRIEAEIKALEHTNQA